MPFRIGRGPAEAGPYVRQAVVRRGRLQPALGELSTIRPVSGGRTDQVAVSRFIEFTRAEWARLRLSTPLPLSEPQLRPLVGLNEWMSLDEVADIYLPLSRLLNLYVGATQRLHRGHEHVPRSGRPAHAVRHRRRRQRGSGEEHHLAHPAGAARALAEPSAGGSDHDRRVPPAAARARGARSRAPQGFPRELRRAEARPLPGRREVGCARSVRARVLAPGVRHRGRPSSRSSASRTSSSSRG